MGHVLTVPSFSAAGDLEPRIEDLVSRINKLQQGELGCLSVHPPRNPSLHPHMFPLPFAYDHPQARMCAPSFTSSCLSVHPQMLPLSYPPAAPLIHPIWVDLSRCTHLYLSTFMHTPLCLLPSLHLIVSASVHLALHTHLSISIHPPLHFLPSLLPFILSPSSPPPLHILHSLCIPPSICPSFHNTLHHPSIMHLILSAPIHLSTLIHILFSLHPSIHPSIHPCAHAAIPSIPLLLPLTLHPTPSPFTLSPAKQTLSTELGEARERSEDLWMELEECEPLPCPQSAPLACSGAPW